VIQVQSYVWFMVFNATYLLIMDFDSDFLEKEIVPI